MKKGLLSKIVDLLKQADREEQLQADCEANIKAKPEFVIPSEDILNLIANQQPLTMWQIKEVLSYIRANYYFCDNKSILDNFAFEWTLCGGNIDEINDRIENACTAIVYDLRNGRKIDSHDALWFSTKIYADGMTSDKRRIISKKIDGNCAIFDVESQEKNPTIYNDIKELRKQLNANNHTNSLAYGL